MQSFKQKLKFESINMKIFGDELEVGKVGVFLGFEIKLKWGFV
jgi:hypothetical protein